MAKGRKKLRGTNISYKKKINNTMSKSTSNTAGFNTTAKTVAKTKFVPKRPKFEVVTLGTVIPVNIPNTVFSQMKFLCESIPNVEWSGPIFYEVNGTISDPENCSIELLDILPLDKGTSAATAYDLGSDVIDHRMSSDALMDANMGHKQTFCE